MKPRNGIWMSDFRLSNGERIRVSLKTRDKAEAKVKERELQVVMEKGLKESPGKGSKKPPAGSSGPWSGISLKQAFNRATKEYEPWRASTSKKTIEGNYGILKHKFRV